MCRQNFNSLVKMKQALLLISIAFFTPLSHAAFYECTNKAGETIFKDSECDDSETLNQRIDPESLSKKHSVFTPVVDDSNPLGKNLVLNADFEDQLIDWVVPLGALWSSNGGIRNSGGLIIHADKPPEDKYIHETVVSQCVVLNGGSKFGLSARFKSLGTPLKVSANRVNVIWYESSDCTSGGQWGAYIEPKKFKAGWQNLNRNNLTPALGVKAAKITIVQNGRYSNNEKGFWDNIRFFATEVFNQSERGNDAKAENEFAPDAGTNYVLNGDFKKDISPWRPGWKTEWSGIQGDKFPGSAKVTARSKTGSIGKGAFSQCVNIGGGIKFELGASFKSGDNSTQKGGGRLRLTWREGQNCHGPARTTTQSADPSDIAGWQRLKVSGLHAPATAKSATIEIIQTVAAKGEFIAFWDDIYFVAID